MAACGGGGDEAKTEELMDYSGTWKLITNENQSNYLSAIGVGMIKRKLMDSINITIVIKQKGNELEIEVKPTGKAAETTKTTVGGDAVLSMNRQGKPLSRKFTKNEKGMIVVETKVNTKNQEKDGPWDPKRNETRVWKLEGKKLTFEIENTSNGNKMSQIYEKQ